MIINVPNDSKGEDMADQNPVIKHLTDNGVSEDVAKKIIDELGAESIEDLSYLTVEHLLKLGLKEIPAKKLVAKLKPAPAPAPAAEAAAAVMNIDAVLPPVPTDESWLKSLRAGGVLKVDESTVNGTIRAALAHRAGLYQVPEKLVVVMERFADEAEEPVGPDFFKVRKLVTKRSYADLFEGIEGLDGTFVTEARKRKLLDRLDSSVWPALEGMNSALQGWQQAWIQGGANPMLMLGMAMGGARGVMPPGMLTPPDTGVLRDAAEAVNDACNQAFKGTGVQIAAALAFEAQRVVEIINTPNLHALTGAVNRDQLLKQLGVAVPATYPRLETNVIRFALATMKVKDVAAGDEELRYFSSLFTLGTQIPWEQLTGGRSGGLGIGENGGKPGYGRSDEPTRRR